MANKKRRNKKLKRQAVAASAARQPTTEAPAGTAASEPLGATSTAPRPASPAAKAPAYATGVSGPRSRGGTAATTTIDIDARVPYFASDLRRIALTAGILVAVIVAASFFIH